MLLNLFKTSSFYFLGLIVSKALSVLVFVVFARVLLPTGFGQFIFFVTIVQLVTVGSDLGLNQWYQKKVESVETHDLLNRLISARTLSLIVSAILTSAILLHTKIFSGNISFILLLTLIPEAYQSVFDGYYLEKKQTLKVSGKVSLKMIILFFGFLFTMKGFNIESATIIYLIASAITLIWYFPKNAFKSFSGTSINISIATFRESVSYALLILTSFAYSRGDSLIVGSALGNNALGLYGSSYRYLESLSLIPIAISHNLFPISAKKSGIAKNQLLKILIFMSLAGLLISVPVFLTGGSLITAILGDAYIKAIPLLKIFSFVILLFFINSPLSTVVQSSNLVKKFLPFGIVNTLLNIALNIIFIPKYGVTAAAWVMLITETSGLFINLFFVNRLYKKSFNPLID